MRMKDLTKVYETCCVNSIKKSFSKIISNLKEHVDFMVKVNVI